MPGRPAIDRLMERVDTAGPVPAERPDLGPCWLWTGPLTKGGYGTFTVRGVRGNAHRMLYIEMVGPVPRHLDVDHLCRVRRCVNPAHMEPVTRSENLRRGRLGEVNRARANARTHCVNGHALTEDNTYRPPGRGRACRTCLRAAGRAYKQRRSAA